MLEEDYVRFQKKKVAEIRAISIEKLIEDTKSLPISEDSRYTVSETLWPSSVKTLSPVLVFRSDKVLTLYFYRMGGVEDGVSLFIDRKPPAEAPHVKYTDFGDGIVWFYSRL